jgi:NAD(P)H-hydrate epimerase
MVGGPAFAALGALRTGAGLAVLALPAPLMAAGLTIAPSATGLALPVDKAARLDPSAVAEVLDRYVGQFDCLAVGPGLGDDEPQRRIMARLVSREDVPLVIDADALNALAGLADFGRDLKAQAVITPHPGEYRRLAEALGLDTDPAGAASRSAAAAQLARRLGCVVVLKGAGTVVSDGISTWTNTSGNVALATAATGDVLTGVIAGLVAQHARAGGLSLYDCARLGVHAHGLAADRWSAAHGDTGLLAGELLQELPHVLAELRGGG